MHPFCKINKNKQTNTSTIENRRKQLALQVSQEKKIILIVTVMQI